MTAFEATPARAKLERLAPYEEILSSLWMSLSGGPGRTPPARMLFTGSSEQEGVTTIGACAALGLARYLRQSTVLVEAHYQRPGLASLLELPPERGLVHVLSGQATLAEVLCTSELDGLSFLPAGQGPTPERGAFAGERFAALMAELGRTHRCVLIDSPPLLQHSDARVLLRQVDRVIPVMRAGHTRKTAAAALLRVLGEAGVPVGGAVLNRYRQELPAWVAGRR
jgi:Mrp family chromosome partitioning ATPase